MQQISPLHLREVLVRATNSHASYGFIEWRLIHRLLLELILETFAAHSRRHVGYLLALQGRDALELVRFELLRRNHLICARVSALREDLW